ncbi:sugar-binding protein [Kribbella solani]|uniref:sugar-binding protein n=1 Tax=Kribbella solani TaxID=236067 RepID=UPI0029AC8C14|nr:sugar-binding protein [Kribbella solani]MDX3002846.1 sugar-binding protein [Kribbella solani]
MTRRRSGAVSLLTAGLLLAAVLQSPARAATAAAPTLTITPTTVGNTFTVGQQVQLGFSTDATTVSWTVRDAAGTEVSKGSASAAALNGRLTLPISTPGWYQTDLAAVAADGSTTLGGTDFAVLTPHDFSTSTDTRIGVASALGFGGVANPGLEAVPLMANGGISTARDEAFWSAAETTKGVIQFPQKVKDYKKALDDNHVDFLNILDYGNSLYYPDEAPSTDEQRAAFTRYAVAAVDEFGTEHTTYELWNEWNLRDQNGAAKASPENYVALLKSVSAAVRAKHPDVKLTGPSLAVINDWQGWFTKFADLGGLDYVDAVTIHPYVQPLDPEASVAYVNTIRGIMAAHGSSKPIYITEQGWATGTNPSAVSEPAQARDLVRGQLLSYGNGVARYSSYNFMDSGNNPSDVEHRFGMVRNRLDSRGALAPKPSYVATAVLARQIDQLPLIGQTRFGTNGYDVSFNAGSGQSVHAVWSTTPGLVNIAAPAGSPVQITDLYGVTTTLTADAGGHVWMTAGPDPFYARGAITGVAPSNRFGLSMSPEIAGDPATGTLTFTNPDAVAHTFTVSAGGTETSGSAAAGATATAAVAYPAQDSTGPRTYSAKVSVDGQPVGLVSAAGTATPPLSVTASHVLNGSGKDLLRFRVTNSSSQPITLSGLDWTAGAASGTLLAGCVVPAHGTDEVDVALTLDQATTWSASLRRTGAADIQASGKLVPVTAPTVAKRYTVNLDGVIDPVVARQPAIALEGTGTPPVTGWGGPSDLSGRLWLTHDDQNLYLSAKVTDDVFSQPSRGGNIWGGDGLQLGMTAGAPGEAVQTQEIGAALTDAGPVDTWRWTPTSQTGVPPGVQAKVVRDEAAHTTTYEIAVPWSTLGVVAKDRLIAATVVLNENDGTGRRGWLTWGKGVAETKNPALFNAIRLDPSAAR